MLTEVPGGLDQERSNRPRPTVCSQATSTSPPGAAARAWRTRSLLVDSVWGTTCTRRHGADGVCVKSTWQTLASQPVPQPVVTPSRLGGHGGASGSGGC